MRTLSKDLEKFISDEGGLNPWNEPNYRFVWGADRMELRAAEWRDCDEHDVLIRSVKEVRDVPKYHDKNVWHLETWFPPGPLFIGSEAQWNETMGVMDNGTLIVPPYPRRGEYEAIWQCREFPGGPPIEPTIAIAERAIRLHRHAMQARSVSAFQMKYAEAKARVEKKDKDRRNRIVEVVDDALVEWFGQPWVALPGKES